MSKLVRNVLWLLVAGLLMACLVVIFPALWIYARFHPRKKGRVLFWTNEGFCVAPSRVRSYRFCREAVKMGIEAAVLSFWDHLEGFTGLPPYRSTPAHKVWLLLRSTMAAVSDGAGIIVAQRPLYDVLSLLALKLMYPWSLRIWIDVDDWIFDYVLAPPPANVRFSTTLPLHALIAEGCFVSSRHLEQEMNKNFKRVVTVPTFVDHELFRPSTAAKEDSSEGRVVFSWIGTLFLPPAVNDILFLAEVLESLHDPRVVLEVVGDGEHLTEVRSKVRQTCPNLTVSFLGWREPDAIPAYMQSIDVGLYCLTTHDDFCRSKSPTKLFEYMAVAKPSVSTAFGEAPRFVEHGVTGFVASGFEEFAACCSRLANDPELRMSMGRNARKRIEEAYNLSHGVKIIQQTLRDAKA